MVSNLYGEHNARRTKNGNHFWAKDVSSQGTLELIRMIPAKNRSQSTGRAAGFQKVVSHIVRRVEEQLSTINPTVPTESSVQTVNTPSIAKGSKLSETSWSF